MQENLVEKMENGTLYTWTVEAGNCTPFSTVRLILTLIPTTVILLIVLMGNLLVLLSFFKVRALRTPQNVYLLSMAILDLTQGLFILPLNIQYQVRGCWKLGIGLCKLYITSDITLCIMSAFHLCAISVDRYRAITDGSLYVQWRSLKTVLGTIFGIFIVALWISSPPLLGWTHDWANQIEVHKRCVGSEHLGFILYSAFGSLILPFSLMIILYTRIYFAMTKKLRNKFVLPKVIEEEEEEEGVDESPEGKNVTSHPAVKVVNLPLKRNKSKFRKNSSLSIFLQDFMAKQQKFSVSRERRDALTLGRMIGAFFLCWLPFLFMYVLAPFLEFCFDLTSPPGEVFEAFKWLGYLNSAINPIIYGVYSPEFRNAYKHLLHLD